jgi:hypothetical protein
MHPLPSATGIVLAVQESRLRLLTERGQGLLFLLAHDARLEPQDLPRLANRRVRLRYVACDPRRLLAGVVQDIRLLDDTSRHHHREARPA